MPRTHVRPLLRLLLCGALACLHAAPAHAAPRPLAFTAVDSLGADSRAILAMLQDRQGFVWIGTIEGGLFRHDGHKQVRYMNDPADPHSLPGGRVTSLYEDETGRLWIGTDEGLARFDPVTNSFTRYVPAGGPGNARIVRRIVSDFKGGMWVATWGGLHHFDPRKSTFTTYRHDEARPDSLLYNDVNAVAVDTKGAVWAATWPGGLDYLAPGATGFQHFRVDDPEHPNPKANDVRALYLDSAATLWIGSADGLVTWKSGQPWERREALAVQAKRVTDIDEDRAGDMWISTRTSGLLRWDRERRQFQSYRHRAEDAHSLNSDAINTTMRDRSGTLWVGSLTDGVSRANLGYHGFERFVPRDIDPGFVKSSNFVRSVGAAANNQLWLALDDGLALFDPSTREMVRTWSATPKRPGALSSNVIYSTYQAPDGTLWVGTSEGLNRLDKPDAPFKVIHFGSKTTDFINAIAPGRGGVLWLGTGTALLRYDTASGAVRSYAHDDQDPASRSVNGASTVAEDSAGRVWSGEFYRGGGLDMLDPASGKFRHFRFDPNNPASLSSDRVSSLHQDADGSMWVGTSKGLNHVVAGKDGAFDITRIQEKGELGTRLIEAIRSDKNGMIWVTTAAGLSKIDPVSGTVTEYSVEDGLTEGFYIDSAANSANGFLYFGSSSGVTAVNPAIHSSASRPPQLAITDIRVLNRSLGGKNPPQDVVLEGGVTQPRSLSLPWIANTISIEFAALHFAEPRRNAYSYWLEGFDTQPVQADAAHPVATYTNLAPGKYRFHLQGSNNKGVASRDEIVLPITITPPVWETWWARGAVALLAVALLLLLFRWAVWRLGARAQALEAQLQERSEALRIAQHKLANLSATDNLTGIANRRCFDDQLAREWRRAARDKKPMAIGLVEIDKLAAYREHHGQQAADEVLRLAAHALSGAVQRAGDLVARYGADQFAFLAPATAGDEAMRIARRMEAALVALNLPNVKATSGVISASIGVASLPATQEGSIEDLVLAADQALYLARSEGGNRSVLAPEDTEARVA
ncbi:diguanylate cyclase [Rugamonas sp. FT82W]|uniref:Diguanylate cyclase n=1 Tax=Duganella vulcania TaxID=2692166 RepID=A0A845G4K8_9BURK|nr:ligand-binding sensor domain-containing diguanylate cyclase [Duganella vulcania]MYM87819.1 diguanylate cyclase [Duganella vulcania]